VGSLDKSKLHSRKINDRLNWGNSCYFATQNHLSSRLVYEDVKIMIHKTLVSLIFYAGVILGRLLRKIVEPKTVEVTGD
jgi:hypothetical protein